MELHLILGAHGGIGKTLFAMVLGTALRRPHKCLLMVDLDHQKPRLYHGLHGVYNDPQDKILDRNHNYKYFKVPYISQYVVKRETHTNISQAPVFLMDHVLQIVNHFDQILDLPPKTCVIDCPLTLSNLSEVGRDTQFPPEFQYRRVVIWFIVDLPYLSKFETRETIHALSDVRKNLPYFLPQRDFKMIIQPHARNHLQFNKVKDLKQSLDGLSGLQLSEMLAILADLAGSKDPETEIDKFEEDLIYAISKAVPNHNIRRPKNILPLESIADLDVKILEGTQVFGTTKEWSKYLKPAINELFRLS